MNLTKRIKEIIESINSLNSQVVRFFEISSKRHEAVVNYLDTNNKKIIDILDLTSKVIDLNDRIIVTKSKFEPKFEDIEKKLAKHREIKTLKKIFSDYYNYDQGGDSIILQILGNNLNKDFLKLFRNGDNFFTIIAIFDLEDQVLEFLKERLKNTRKEETNPITEIKTDFQSML